MAILAQADAESLEAAWCRLSDCPNYDLLRKPEIGMVMIRGRVDGDGRPFNLGEMSVTRCAIRLANGNVGVSYVAGRRLRHAEMAAVFDGLLQDPDWRLSNGAALLTPLAEARERRRQEVQRRIAETRVAFFTMARGDDGS